MDDEATALLGDPSPRRRVRRAAALSTVALCAAAAALSRGGGAIGARGGDDSGGAPLDLHDTHDASLYVAKIVEAASAKLDGAKFECELDFAYCAASSCTRHPNATTAGGVEIGACACQPVQGLATVNFGVAASGFLVAASPGYLRVLEDFARGADGDDDAVALETVHRRACEALRDRDDVYATLRPDRLSLPAASWSGPERPVVRDEVCEHDVAVALCPGAPCFDDPTAAGPLNVTCLCPLYPFGSADKEFKLTPPDVGHMGECKAYRYRGGSCAMQGTSELEGRHFWKWAVAAVRSMTFARRDTDASICRDYLSDEA